MVFSISKASKSYELGFVRNMRQMRKVEGAFMELSLEDSVLVISIPLVLRKDGNQASLSHLAPLELH